MLAAMPHRWPDGTRVARLPHCVLGFALRATTARERAAAQPLHDRRPGCGSWPTLASTTATRWLAPSTSRRAGLGCRAPAARFRRLGAALASRLEGTSPSRPGTSGGESSPWRATPWACDLSSGGPPGAPCSSPARWTRSSTPAGKPRSSRRRCWTSSCTAGRGARTFFRGVQRLPPGHVLEASDGSVHDLGRARPPLLHPEPPPGWRGPPGSAASCAVPWPPDSMRRGRWCWLFLAASIRAPSPAWPRTSTGRTPPSPLLLAAAVFPGFAGDETRYLEAVLSGVHFACERWDASAHPPAAPEALPRAHPIRDRRRRGGRVLEVARAAGSRVLLMGLGGDELFTEVGALEDLARHGRFVALARETLRRRPYTATPAPPAGPGPASAAPAWTGASSAPPFLGAPRRRQTGSARPAAAVAAPAAAPGPVAFARPGRRGALLCGENLFPP